MGSEAKAMQLEWVRQMVEILLRDGVTDDAEEMHLSVSYIKSQGDPKIHFRVVSSKEVGAEEGPILPQEAIQILGGWTTERKVSHGAKMRDYWQRRKESASPRLTA